VNISVYQNASALRSVEQWQDITAHNLSTSSVAGFKKTDASFESVKVGQLPKETLSEFERGFRAQYPLIDGQYTMRQGDLRQTANPYDVAIEGDGFFELDSGNGNMLYSRDGHFRLNADSVLVSSTGKEVQGENGRIQILPAMGEVIINKKGEVTQERAPNTIIARLRIVNFEDPQKLGRMPGGFRAAGQEPQQIQEPQVLQNFVENSNVNPIQEMVNMISLSRIHEANQKMISSYDQIFGKAISSLGESQ
jgi:flagellar basal-body rod protein FlgF